MKPLDNSSLRPEDNIYACTKKIVDRRTKFIENQSFDDRLTQSFLANHFPGSRIIANDKVKTGFRRMRDSATSDSLF